MVARSARSTKPPGTDAPSLQISLPKKLMPQKSSSRKVIPLDGRVPTRISRFRNLTPIPTEIYLQILDHVVAGFPTSKEMEAHHERYRTLCNLSRVSKLFRALSIPLLYRNLHISGLRRANTTSPSSSDENPFNTAAFCRSVNSGNNASAVYVDFVRAVSLHDWLPSQHEPTAAWTIPGFLNLYGKALTHFNKLESLDLVRVMITPKFLRYTSRLGGLKSFYVNECLFSDDKSTAGGSQAAKRVVAGANRSEGLGRLKLKEFVLSVQPDVHLGHLTDIIDTSQLERFCSNHSDANTIILQSLPRSNALQVLELSRVKPHPILWSTLSHCTNLQELKIDFISPSVDNFESVTLPRFPNLTRIECPPALMKIIRTTIPDDE